VLARDALVHVLGAVVGVTTGAGVPLLPPPPHAERTAADTATAVVRARLRVTRSMIEGAYPLFLRRG
jgi:hypothetical protein